MPLRVFEAPQKSPPGVSPLPFPLPCLVFPPLTRLLLALVDVCLLHAQPLAPSRSHLLEEPRLHCRLVKPDLGLEQLHLGGGEGTEGEGNGGGWGEEALGKASV